MSFSGMNTVDWIYLLGGIVLTIYILMKYLNNVNEIEDRLDKESKEEQQK